MKPNYLHIWPRNTFMMIALPNLVSVNFIFFSFVFCSCALFCCCESSNVSCVFVRLLHIFLQPLAVTVRLKHNHFRTFQDVIDLWDALIELISLFYRRSIVKRGLVIKRLTYFSHGSVPLLISLSVSFRQTSLCLSCPS